AFHSDTHQIVEGWVSCGSHIFIGCTLSLPDGSELVMPRREAKKYLSEIEVTTEESKESYQISVNHPASIGAWKIYQSGYDSTRGRWSTTSTLECVKDGWYIPVHIAMWMILIAGIMMFIWGWKEQRKEEKK
ncbi:MAG: cytochrome c biogenesis protein ResB, partial [Bacteroides sp]|nr:cytochrome c biogenesis protein ResB [Bacteroides sp.]